jgi:hypothetical protein
MEGPPETLHTRISITRHPLMMPDDALPSAGAAIRYHPRPAFRDGERRCISPRFGTSRRRSRATSTFKPVAEQDHTRRSDLLSGPVVTAPASQPVRFLNRNRAGGRGRPWVPRLPVATWRCRRRGARAAGLDDVEPQTGVTELLGNCSANSVSRCPPPTDHVPGRQCPHAHPPMAVGEGQLDGRDVRAVRHVVQQYLCDRPEFLSAGHRRSSSGRTCLSSTSRRAIETDRVVVTCDQAAKSDRTVVDGGEDERYAESEKNDSADKAPTAESGVA